MQRAFRRPDRNELWVVDFTYVATWSGMAFTAFVTEVISRLIVGWRTAASMPTELPLDAVAHSLNTRPRKRLRWRRPSQAVNELLASA
jgi:putative transposase